MGTAVTLGATLAAPAGSPLLMFGYVSVMCTRPYSVWATCWASQHNMRETQSLPLRRSPEGGGDRPSVSSAEWEVSQDAVAPGGSSHPGFHEGVSRTSQAAGTEARRREGTCYVWAAGRDVVLPKGET